MSSTIDIGAAPRHTSFPTFQLVFDNDAESNVRSLRVLLYLPNSTSQDLFVALLDLMKAGDDALDGPKANLLVQFLDHYENNLASDDELLRCSWYNSVSTGPRAEDRARYFLFGDRSNAQLEGYGFDCADGVVYILSTLEWLRGKFTEPNVSAYQHRGGTALALYDIVWELDAYVDQILPIRERLKYDL